MSKNQTRRSISYNGKVFELAQELAAKYGVSMSALAEVAVLMLPSDQATVDKIRRFFMARHASSQSDVAALRAVLKG